MLRQNSGNLIKENESAERLYVGKFNQNQYQHTLDRDRTTLSHHHEFSMRIQGR